MSHCLTAYKKAEGDLINSSDQRDLDLSGGLTAFNAYAEPKPPGFFSSVPFDTYEIAFTQLYSIENSIGAAKAIRETAAIKKLDDAKSSVEMAKGLISSAFKATLQRPGPLKLPFGGPLPWAFVIPGDRSRCAQFLKAAAPSLVKAKAKLDTAIATLGDAAKLAPIIQTDIDSEAAAAAVQRLRTTDPNTFCNG